MENETKHGKRRLEGRNAIVTGASRGIGRAVAVALAREGANIAVHYRERVDLATETARLCEDCGVQSVVIQADVAKEDDVKRMFVESTQLGIPSILVNNAGISDYGLASDLTLSRWREILDVNLTSMFLCTREAIPYFRRTDGARIVNVSSIQGIEGAAMEAAYAATKGGVIAWTKSMARELASFRITVNCVAPGAIDTDMLTRFDEEERRAMVDATPLGRLGTPEDVAELIAYLASPSASFITGQVMSPNGGLLT